MNLVISPHTDDAIFSLGSYLQKLKDVVIISPFAGVPEDKAGKEKHELLRTEHEAACGALGVNFINGEFLDDVYGPRDKRAVKSWLSEVGYDSLYFPLGIHHPDHILVSDIMLEIFDRFQNIYVYEELPYRVLYPELVKERISWFNSNYRLTMPILCDNSPKKSSLVRIYSSQTRNNDILEQLAEPEKIWKLK